MQNTLESGRAEDKRNLELLYKLVKQKYTDNLPMSLCCMKKRKRKKLPKLPYSWSSYNFGSLCYNSSAYTLIDSDHLLFFKYSQSYFHWSPLSLKCYRTCKLWHKICQLVIKGHVCFIMINFLKSRGPANGGQPLQWSTVILTSAFYAFV